MDSSKLNREKLQQDRKAAHIALVTLAQVSAAQIDNRFFYEPLLAALPNSSPKPISWLGKTIKTPIWVSSMTGGTNQANRINHALAKACRTFGMGMALGSCRQLLHSDERVKDFALRETLGPEQLFFANLGIAQIEEAILKQDLDPIHKMITMLEADGLVIHVNPLQEYLQPEGSIFKLPPIETIETFLKEVNYPIIVKEVGQGMGPASLKALLQLPLAAIEFGGFGGTNFSRLELLRSEKEKQVYYEPIVKIGHTAEQMLGYVNQIVEELGPKRKCNQLIVSGGIKNFLDGYYLVNLSKIPAFYGQASVLFFHAQKSYEALESYLDAQRKGLAIANTWLKVKQRSY